MNCYNLRTGQSELAKTVRERMRSDLLVEYVQFNVITMNQFMQIVDLPREVDSIGRKVYRAHTNPNKPTLEAPSSPNSPTVGYYH